MTSFENMSQETPTGTRCFDREESGMKIISRSYVGLQRNKIKILLRWSLIFPCFYCIIRTIGNLCMEAAHGTLSGLPAGAAGISLLS